MHNYDDVLGTWVKTLEAINDLDPVDQMKLNIDLVLMAKSLAIHILMAAKISIEPCIRNGVGDKLPIPTGMSKSNRSIIQSMLPEEFLSHPPITMHLSINLDVTDPFTTEWFAAKVLQEIELLELSRLSGDLDRVARHAGAVTHYETQMRLARAGTYDAARYGNKTKEERRKGREKANPRVKEEHALWVSMDQQLRRDGVDVQAERNRRIAKHFTVRVSGVKKFFQRKKARG